MKNVKSITSCLRLELVFTLVLFFTSFTYPHKTAQKGFQRSTISSVEQVAAENYKQFINEAKEYVKRNQLNTDFFILIDYRIHSGRYRFFVIDFAQHSITQRFLVSHGCGKANWGGAETKQNPVFSNVPESYCSSLGKYHLKDRGYSNWGVHVKYLMHGVEQSNSNALKRTIVFHSWDLIADKEIYPNGTPEGWGCPAISNNAFLVIDEQLKSQSKPTLMWITG